MLTRKGLACWLEAGRGHRPCPQPSHRSGGMRGCFPFTACTSPSDAAWCSKAPACVRRPQLPQSSPVGRHQCARNQPSLPEAQHVPLLSLVLGTRCQRGARGGSPVHMLCSPPSLPRGTQVPPNLANTSVPVAWGGRDRGVPVAPCPCLLADRWRCRISLGDNVPAGSPGDLGLPTSTPPATGTPLAPAASACSSAGRGKGSSTEKQWWILLPRQGKASGCSREGLWPSATLHSALLWRE